MLDAPFAVFDKIMARLDATNIGLMVVAGFCFVIVIFILIRTHR